MTFNAGAGGTGGGGVSLKAETGGNPSALTVSGTINVDGVAGETPSQGASGGGGGSGGGILLDGMLDVSGVLSARGGAGGGARAGVFVLR